MTPLRQVELSVWRSSAGNSAAGSLLLYFFSWVLMQYLTIEDVEHETKHARRWACAHTHAHTHTKPLPTANFGDLYGIYSPYLNNHSECNDAKIPLSPSTIGFQARAACLHAALFKYAHPPYPSTLPLFEMAAALFVFDIAIRLDNGIQTAGTTISYRALCSRRATSVQFQILSLPTNKNKTRKPNNDVIG